MKPFLVSALTLVSVFAHCQIKEFYTYFEAPTDSASSYYYAVGKKDWVQIGTNGFLKYVGLVHTYYTATGNLRSDEFYSKDGTRVGDYVVYHPNGQVKEKGKYLDDRKTGMAIRYYASGATQFDAEYYADAMTEPSVQKVIIPEVKIKVINYWDSLGNQLVRDGQGNCNCQLLEAAFESGKIVDGFRDSVWSGYQGSTLLFRETYRRGQLVSGESYGEEGIMRYEIIMEPPQFKGGYPEMMNFIRKNLRYPASARRLGVDGMALIRFVVGKTGSIEDAQIAQGVTPDIDAESLRVVRLMDGKWEPGKLRGRPVFVRFFLPIKFKLK